MIKPLNINMHMNLVGRYRMQVIRSDGLVRQDTGWFDNLITNQGLDQIGGLRAPFNAPFGAPYLNTICAVGTGTTTPAFTDTQLTNFGAASANPGGGVFGATKSYVSTTPQHWSAVWSYTFAAGVATGTWSEIGVGNYYSSTDTQPALFSHALIVDGSGNPTTITVLSSESLVVTYELDYYINTTTNSYSVIISTVPYSGNYLRANITSVPTIDISVGYGTFGNNNTYINVYNGTIGTITGTPSGAAAGGPNDCSGSQVTPYTNGTYYNQFSVNFATSQGNVSGGITALMISHSSAGSWQFSVSPAIPKTSSYQLTLNYNISWARYP
jgi:hypothetical protein